MPLTTAGVYHSTDSHRFEILVDAITDYAIYMLDPDGFVTTWNTGAERIKGYRSAEIMGQHFSRFFTSADQAKGVPDAFLELARREGRYEEEGWRVRKDGSRFLCNAIVHRIQDERGNIIGFAKITRDITERMEAEVALRESEHRFRLLVEGVTDYVIYMLDPSGVIVNWNTGAERLKGYSADEIIGQHFSKFYAREDRAAGMPGRVLATAALEGRYEGEGWRIRKDGSRFWALVVVDAIRNQAGGIEGFAKVTRAITDRRLAQETLRDSERQFRLLVAGVTDYALYMIDPNGIVTSWNAGAERIKGYTSDEIIGLHFSRFYTERDRAAGMPARALHTALQEGRYKAEGWRVRKDGSLFWANAIIDPIRDENGDLVGFAKITRDITERREAQNALEEAQQQRAHLQKMDALGQLTGGVAHDFNNLLMVVSGQAELLKGRAADNPKIMRAVDAIEHAATRGGTLTRQLLTFSRRHAMAPSVLELPDRIEGFRSMMASSLGAAVTLVVNIEPTVWRVKLDPNEFELALVNITLNARDAMPNGGMISLTAANVTLAPSDTIARVQGEFVALRISDTGTGIAPDLLPKIFDPFFTTKPTGKGTGLGLSQVYGIVRQAGGDVAIESKLGKGTTVTLRLPRAAHGSLHENRADTAFAKSLTAEKLLLVDDDADVREIVGRVLLELGYDVRQVASGEAALATFDEFSPDLLVVDFAMPGMNGAEVVMAARQRNAGLKILFLSGFADSEVLETAVGATPLLRKPFRPSELAAAVRSALDSQGAPLRR